MTPEILRAATGCSAADAETFAPHLTEACEHYGITTPERLAAFLGQIGHESGSLRYVREIANGRAYEGRRDLGNDQPGDGPRYRGRGLIQCTGRANYRAMAQWLSWAQCPAFEALPEALEEPRWAALSAAAWWDAHKLNDLADRGEYVAIGREINRGNRNSEKPANGEADRLARWEKAKAALQSAPVETTQAVPPEPEHVQEPPPIEWPFDRPAPESQTMPIPIVAALGGSLLSGLAGTLIEIFSPLAKEKVTKELGRHTTPEVAAQVSTAIIEAAKTATGKADPVQAVAAVREAASAGTGAQMIQQIETSALDTLDRLAPLLEKVHQWQMQGRAADEASMDAASRRAVMLAGDRMFLRFGSWLHLSFIEFLSLLLVAISASGALWLGLAGKLNDQLLGAIVTLMLIAGYTGVREFWLGSSRGSDSKQMVIDELARRGKA